MEGRQVTKSRKGRLKEAVSFATQLTTHFLFVPPWLHLGLAHLGRGHLCRLDAVCMVIEEVTRHHPRLFLLICVLLCVCVCIKLGTEKEWVKTRKEKTVPGNKALPLLPASSSPPGH